MSSPPPTPCNRHGADWVDEACRRALDAEAVNVGLIDRMLTRDNAVQATEPICGNGKN